MIKKIFLLAAVGGTMLSTVSCSDNSSKDDEIIPDLIISEVMFHPVTQDSAEFIEICNTGTQAADIRNMELKGGAEFTFGADLPDLAPGSCVVLAQDFSRFANAYPEVSVLGEYSGKLSNEGDDLELETSEGSSIFKMSYNDSPPLAAPGRRARLFSGFNRFTSVRHRSGVDSQQSARRHPGNIER